MTESVGRKWLVDMFKTHTQYAKVQPIESAVTGNGIPDIYFRTRTRDGWIELKVAHFDLESNVDIDFRPGQLPWIKHCNGLGGNAMLFVFIRDIEVSAAYGLHVFRGANILPRYTMAQFFGSCSFSQLNYKDITVFDMQTVLNAYR